MLLNNSTRNAFACVARGLRFVIIRIGMDDDSMSDNSGGAVKPGSVVHLGKLRDSCRIRDDVAEITQVPLDGIGGGVRHSGGVKMASGRCAIGRGAIALFVNVKAVLAGLEAGDLAVNADAVGGAAEVNSALRDA